ncbi:MAG: PIN domain-containing protein [Propionibacteriaceae bacterium]|jgi:predicted nucleic acid-binding protein|nr:PIN domain-containing protein [Propionibacteriaceae bacterium]
MTLQFLDTNVLLYAYDASAGDKHNRAAELVLELARSHQAAISVQVMQEFYANAVSKIAKRLTPDAAVERLRAFSHWAIHSPMADDAINAALLATRHQLSYWDSMIVNSAAQLGCTVLWSEDLNSGQVIEGLMIRNPFAG